MAVVITVEDRVEILERQTEEIRERMSKLNTLMNLLQNVLHSVVTWMMNSLRPGMH